MIDVFKYLIFHKRKYKTQRQYLLLQIRWKRANVWHLCERRKKNTINYQKTFVSLLTGKLANHSSSPVFKLIWLFWPSIQDLLIWREKKIFEIQGLLSLPFDIVQILKKTGGENVLTTLVHHTFVIVSNQSINQ